MYRLKGSEFHLPIFWITWSEKPYEAARVAAPILKLLPLNWSGLKPINLIAALSYEETTEYVIG